MLAAADINGFVVSACSLVIRENGESDTDSSHGTIGRERFILWVKQCLIPVLGNYELRQPRSLVLLDNATIHHSDEIVDLIRFAGAEVVYLSPYSPDLNPIEFYFNIYKKMLKRLHYMNWFMAHYCALHAVTPLHGRNFFYKCEIPLCRKFRNDDISDFAGDVIVYSIVMVVLFHFQVKTFISNVLNFNEINI